MSDIWGKRGEVHYFLPFSSTTMQQNAHLGKVRRADIGGMIYHALNRANFRSRLFK